MAESACHGCSQHKFNELEARGIEPGLSQGVGMSHCIVRLLAVLFVVLSATGARAEAKTVELTVNGKVALGDLVVPEGKSLDSGVLLLTHGTLAHKDMELIEALQTGLAERGIATLAHSLTLGQDRREGMYDCAVPHTHAHEDAIAEIGAWVKWLKENGATSVSLLGHSRGGNQVAWYAMENGGVDKVILLAPALTLSGKVATDVLKRRFDADIGPVLVKAKQLVVQGKGDTMLDVPAFVFCDGGKAAARSIESYYGEDLRRNALANIARINNPILVIAGSKDTAVPDVPKKIKPIADGEKVRFEMIEDADHMFLDFYAEDAADLVAEFVGD